VAYKARYKDIVDILRTDKKVFVSELSQKLSVSEVTIRKDLSRLEEMGVLRRFHSGAVCIEDSIIDVPVKQKLTENMDLKVSVAQKAYSLIQNKTSIVLDAGSTTSQLARVIKDRSDLTLKIVTNSLTVGEKLAEVKGIELVLTGGNVRIESQALVGPIALENLRKLHVDVAFIGAMGVSLERGFTSSSIVEAQVKETILGIARKKIIIADHTKLNRFSFAPFASLDQVDMLITDGQASMEEIEKLRAAGLEVIC